MIHMNALQVSGALIIIIWVGAIITVLMMNNIIVNNWENIISIRSTDGVFKQCCQKINTKSECICINSIIKPNSLIIVK